MMGILQLGSLGGGVTPHLLFHYISLVDLLTRNTILLTTHSNFSVLNFKL